MIRDSLLSSSNVTPAFFQYSLCTPICSFVSVDASVLISEKTVSNFSLSSAVKSSPASRAASSKNKYSVFRSPVSCTEIRSFISPNAVILQLYPIKSGFFFIHKSCIASISYSGIVISNGAYPSLTSEVFCMVSLYSFTIDILFCASVSTAPA